MRSPMLLFVLTGVVCSCWAADGIATLRPPIATPQFYSDKPDRLQASVKRFLDAAKPVEAEGRLVGLVTPHSAYGLSGAVSAQAFKTLQPGQFNKVVILAPSHFSDLEGCSIPMVAGFQTPLGIVPLDGVSMNKLSRSPLIQSRPLHYGSRSSRPPLHENEYAVEVVLPFLQETLGDFTLIPILVGKLTSANDPSGHAYVDGVAELIHKVSDADTLIVVSSDFTHYGASYKYCPFTENVQPQIEQLDREAFSLLCARNAPGFKTYIAEKRSTICGKDALTLFLHVLPRTARGQVLAYDQSANKTKDLTCSVSFAALAFYDTGNAPKSGSSPEQSSAPSKRAAKVLRLKGNASEERAENAQAEEPQPDSPEAPELEEASQSNPEQGQAMPAASSEEKPEKKAGAVVPKPAGKTHVIEAGPEPDAASPPAASADSVQTPSDSAPEPQPAAAAAPEATPPAAEAAPAAPSRSSSGKKGGPVTIRMKGSRDQDGPVQIDVEGTPKQSGTQGSVSYGPPPKDLVPPREKE